MSLRAINARTQSSLLRSHGLPTESLQMIFKAVVVAKLTYASPAWWGFTTADDRNRMDGLQRRGGRVGFYDGPTVTQMIEEADDRLFNSIVFYEQHLLHRLLPERNYTNYNLRSRRHDRTLLANTDRRNFVYRMILKICTSLTVILLFFYCIRLRFDNL